MNSLINTFIKFDKYSLDSIVLKQIPRSETRFATFVNISIELQDEDLGTFGPVVLASIVQRRESIFVFEVYVKTAVQGTKLKLFDLVLQGIVVSDSFLYFMMAKLSQNCVLKGASWVSFLTILDHSYVDV